jgi:CHAT domain-containing protein
MKKEKNKNAIIIEYYYIHGTDNKIYIFVVSSDSIDIKSVDIKDFNLDNKIDLYLKEISSPPTSTTDNNNINEYLKHAQELSKYLIEPISSYLSDADLIYFVPYGKLHYIPLHTLLLDNKPLIVDHAVTYIPSASLLKFVKNKGTGSIKNCLSCGIVFKEEAKEIVDIFSSGSGSTVYMEEPTKKEFIDRLESTVKNRNGNNDSSSSNNFDILHLSCHGFFNSKDPMSSALIFRDAFLRAKEILDLQINAELVTLSACETGRNENKPGEELVGLTRSFLYAGAPSVLVSLWKVQSETTRDIMIEFYKQLKNRETKTTDLATALQTAQKNIMQTTEHNHPYFWAPFVLVGDWE